LVRYLKGDISAPIALLHLASEFEDSAALLGFLSDTAARLGAGEERAAARLATLRAFTESHRDGFALVRSMGPPEARAMAELPAKGIQAIRDLFDRLAEVDADTAAALYTFGDPRIREAATAEVVAYLRERGVLSPMRRLLELGCGTGRLLEACAPLCGALTGLDVSPAMVARATARLAPLANVEVRLGPGTDLRGFASHSVDVVLAADSWPYVVDLGADAVRRLGQEVARVLVPGGEFVVLNFSYREDESLDVADVRELASELGFAVLEERGRPFTLWDGATWRLRRRER